MTIADPPTILSESEIEVTVEPPGPFAFVPDILLQAVGNAGLYQALSTLQVPLLASHIHCTQSAFTPMK